MSNNRIADNRNTDQEDKGSKEMGDQSLLLLCRQTFLFKWHKAGLDNCAPADDVNRVSCSVLIIISSSTIIIYSKLDA